ncbi:MAG: hypothetical protein R3F59_09110 [Myxococcota bacterium]
MVACGSGAPPTCAAAYDATVASLGAVVGGAGATATFPPRAEYVSRCEALGLPAEALRCLDPDVAVGASAACAAALAPRRAGVEALAAWFVEATPVPVVPVPIVPATDARSQP